MAAPSSVEDRLPVTEGPKLIVYHQTLHEPDGGPPVSLLPLITNSTGVTHVILAAIHINEGPGNITLNDDPPNAAKYDTVWGEVAWLQGTGIKVLGMLGGAAKGSFARLDGNEPARFEAYYSPLRDFIRQRRLNGLDLDVEEEMSLPGIIGLIDRLRADFGPDFLITLAPVATAFLAGTPHLSGFDYRLLDRMRGHEIAWYNAQFYNGWGDANTSAWYEAIIFQGWRPEKIVLGLLTNPCHGGSGFVQSSRLESTLRALVARHPNFGGVMGWEYWRSLPTEQNPWEWALEIARIIRVRQAPQVSAPPPTQRMPIRPYGGTADLPPPPAPFPVESIKSLQDLGFDQQQAVAALNATDGNVELAAGLLFQD
ncbi:glycoside hydrolase family 18 protein [Polychaeton citri CBS 116435]|uniref:Glycoside hydrolase family 18 protein n=1 Tax=Polychaeton citri CBS 116435 TaxID=1314669 RepID=A0A9P4Q6F5_9PEZI|nr:glycoside hydrolase family 18 protein [Polychaeton citri CBS 116435]